MAIVEATLRLSFLSRLPGEFEVLRRLECVCRKYRIPPRLDQIVRQGRLSLGWRRQDGPPYGRVAPLLGVFPPLRYSDMERCQ
jgi:hypothetical protein